jgi:hypothetical protein
MIYVYIVSINHYETNKTTTKIHAFDRFIICWLHWNILICYSVALRFVISDWFVGTIDYIWYIEMLVYGVSKIYIPNTNTWLLTFLAWYRHFNKKNSDGIKLVLLAQNSLLINIRIKDYGKPQWIDLKTP